MTRLLELLRWSINLRLVAVHEHLIWEARRASDALYDAWDDRPKVFAFLDRVSPFGETGYRRVWLRRPIALLAEPRLALVAWLYSKAMRLVGRFAPYVGPGRYEGNGSVASLKVEWLDENSELATLQTGDVSDWYVHAALFEGIEVPWSREPETWLLVTDTHGFIEGTEGPDAIRRFNEIDADYAAASLGYEEEVYP